MTIEYEIDFTAVLPQKQTPRLNEIQTWLNCSVKDIGRGNIIVQIRPGLFILKVHDDDKGKSLENRKLSYFLPGDVGGKKPISVTIAKREIRKRWINPKYVTIWGTHKADLGGLLTNRDLTKHLEMYGTIIDPVEDVVDFSDNAWSLDKKKCRIDLDKELHIPRTMPVEVPTDDGVIKSSLRITYKDQPWQCRRCPDDHVGPCPKWAQDRKREQEIREQKERDTKTLILGDSNLKLVNQNAILADVVASSGAKIGHTCNELQFTNLDKYKNIVLFTGVNNIPNKNEKVEEQAVAKQIDKELKVLEKELTQQVNKGKNVFLTQVANPEHVRNNTRGTNIREKINKEYTDMKNRLKAKNKKVIVDTINWNVFTEEEDYSSVKGVSEKAIVSFLGKVDEKIEGDLRATYLDRELTAHPYSKVTPAYPVGCRKCTQIGHSESSCPADPTKKRNRSEESDGQGPAPKVTSMNQAS